ncbi:unnamed protein product [Toxocara canis]|uniref:Secreted protein n=1 Tax=Toxocara canis TaxID=6265 RepID=A0A183URL2_TOXCA|nr:unnamed protein product [Toxocara canis]
MGLIIILLAICIVSTSAGLLPEEILLRNSIPNCKDGKGPLLAADHVYSCKEGCPEGFVCEYQDEIKRLEKGICCPDLDILYRLYGNDDEAQEQQIGQTKTNRSDISFLISAQSDHQQSNSKREMFEINEVSNRRQNGENVISDRTIRTKKECKALCVKSAESVDKNTHVNVNHFARDAVRSVRSTHYVGMPTMEYAELIHMDIAT